MLRKILYIILFILVFCGHIQQASSQAPFVAVKNPQCTSLLYIDSIVFKDSSVIFYFFFDNKLNNIQFVDRVSIDSKTKIINGSREFPLSSASGINISVPSTKKSPNNDSLLFSLAFPCPDFPITSFEFLENDSSEWKFKIIFFDTINSPCSAINVTLNNFSSYCYKMIGEGQIEHIFQMNRIMYENLTEGIYSNSSEYATCTYYLSSCNLKLENNYEAIRCGREVLSLYKRNPGWPRDNITLAWVNGIISDAYRNLANYDSAIYYGELSLIQKREIYKKETLDEALTLGKLSQMYFSMGEYEKALSYGEENLKIKTKILGKFEETNVAAANNLCRYYATWGKYAESINLAREYAIDSLKNIDIDSYIDFCEILAHCYNSIDNERLCQQFSEEGFNFLCDNPNLVEGNHYFRFANLLFHLSIEERIRILEELCKKTTYHSESHLSLIQNLANEYFQNGEYEKAILLFKQCINGREEIKSINNVKYSDVLIALSDLFLECEDSSGFYSTINKAISETKRIRGESSIEYANVLGNLYFADMKWKDTIHFDLLEELMCSLEDVLIDNVPILSYEDKQCFWNSVNQWFYDVYLSFFIYSELDELGKEDRYDFYNKLANAYNHILFLKGFISNSQISKNSNLYDEDFGKNKIKQSLNKMELRKRAAIYWIDLQKALDNNSVAIEFVEVPDPNNHEKHYLAIATKRNSLPYLAYICSEKDLALYHQNFYSSDFIDMFWMNLVPYFDSITDVYFSLDGFLNTIAIENIQPLSKLPIGDLKFHRLSSTKEIVVQNKENRSINNVVLFGGLNYNCSYFPEKETSSQIEYDYLPNSFDEVCSIDSILRTKHTDSRIFSGNLGTKEMFLSLPDSNINIIHIATHGYYWKTKFDGSEKLKKLLNHFDKSGILKNDSSMVKSGILLAGKCGNGKPSNSFLSSYEISTLNLSMVDLVILSSCQSGLGDVSRDGVVGLQKAFKEAGVKSLLVCLWDVDDFVTKMMMQEFYQNLLSGDSKREALTKAQVVVRNYKDENGIKLFSDPYYWASFILIDALD